MEITLEKVDILRSRANISYDEAVNYLRMADGDVVKALILIEKDEKNERKEIMAKGAQVFERVKEIIKKGNASKLKIKQDDKVIVEIPLTAGVVGTLMAPQLAVVGVVTALATNCSIEIEQRDLRGNHVVESFSISSDETKADTSSTDDMMLQ